MSLSPHLDLAEAVVAEGFDRHEEAVDRLVAEARRRRVNDVVVGIVADRSAPRVVRERALGRVIVAIARRDRRGDGRRPPSTRFSNTAVPPRFVDLVERACA